MRLRHVVRALSAAVCVAATVPTVADARTWTSEPDGAYALHRGALLADLADAPAQDDGAVAVSPTTIRVPAPSGGLVRFRVQDAPVLQPALQAKHPEIRTVVGAGIDDPTARGTFSLTPLGLRGWVTSARGAWAVGDERGAYRAKRLRDLPAAPGFEAEVRGIARAVTAAPGVAVRRAGAFVQRRTYRLALLNDELYASAVGGSANVLAAKSQLLARLNQLYGDDLAIRFVAAGDDTTQAALNRDTEARMFGTGAGDACAPAIPGVQGAVPCFRGASTITEGCSAGPILTDTAVAIASLVPAAQYDVGHLLTGRGGGGVANEGVGGPSKARGCSGGTEPVGYGYASDPVLHEIGHQFGANHSYDSSDTTGANCGPNREATAAYEIGSGSSIMSYAGLCGPDDIQGYSDPYFTQYSQVEIRKWVQADPTAQQETQTVRLQDFEPGETMRLKDAASGEISEGITYAQYIGGSGRDRVAAAAQAVVQPDADADELEPVGVDRFDGGGSNLNANGFNLLFDNGEESVPLDRPRITLEFSGGDGASATTTVVSEGGQFSTNGGTVTTTTNHAPEVTAMANRTIPPLTPFTLSGSVTDADVGDQPVAMWEQDDVGGAAGISLGSNAKTTGPLFRQFGTAGSLVDPAQQDPVGANVATAAGAVRTLPDPAQIAAGNTNAATGECAPLLVGDTVDPKARECFSEFLPSAAWRNTAGAPVLHFRLTARDRNGVGGGVAYDDTALTVAGEPFRVTSQGALPQSAVAGGPLPVTWSTGGTEAGPVGAAQVRLSLSTDGGLTFPTELIAATANDGAETVTLPAGVTTTTARIKVEAVGNVFFDITRADLTIAAPQGPGPDLGGPVSNPGTPSNPGNPTTPPKPSSPKPKLKAAKTLKPKKGAVTVTVSCPTATAGQACAGTLTLALKVGKKTLKASARFSAKGKAAKAVKVKLSKAQRKALRRKRLKGTLTARVASSGATPSTTSTTVRVSRG